MQSNEVLIKKSIDEKWINSLAFFYFVKTKYKNSTIYDYSCRILADKLNMSHSVVNNHVKTLKEKGLIKEYGNNITFIKTQLKHKCTLKINSDSTLDEIKKELYLKLAEESFRQQKYIIDKKVEARNLDATYKSDNGKMSPKDIKFYHSQEVKDLLEMPINNVNINMSDKALAKLLGVSTSTVYYLKKYWNKTKKLKVKTFGWKRLYKFYKHMTLEFNQFIYKGYVHLSKTTEYELISVYGKVINPN